VQTAIKHQGLASRKIKIHQEETAAGARNDGEHSGGLLPASLHCSKSPLLNGALFVMAEGNHRSQHLSKREG
jgi:hypothetical protein